MNFLQRKKWFRAEFGSTAPSPEWPAAMIQINAIFGFLSQAPF
jgi:hypothetical protein